MSPSRPRPGARCGPSSLHPWAPRHDRHWRERRNRHARWRRGPPAPRRPTFMREAVRPCVSAFTRVGTGSTVAWSCAASNSHTSSAPTTASSTVFLPLLSPYEAHRRPDRHHRRDRGRRDRRRDRQARCLRHRAGPGARGGDARAIRRHAPVRGVVLRTGRICRSEASKGERRDLQRFPRCGSLRPPYSATPVTTCP